MVLGNYEVGSTPGVKCFAAAELFCHVLHASVADAESAYLQIGAVAIHMLTVV